MEQPSASSTTPMRFPGPTPADDDFNPADLDVHDGGPPRPQDPLAGREEDWSD